MKLKTICVFCGAKEGKDPKIAKLTSELGKEMSNKNIDIICGGSDCGLMGVVTKAVLAGGRKVIGVFPDILNGVELPYQGISSLLRTSCLPSRKQKMIDLSDAFLILPGGYGTLDEIFEVVVLRRLSANTKPIILFNYNGFWNYMLKQIDLMVDEGFIEEQEKNLFIIINNIDEFKNYIK